MASMTRLAVDFGTSNTAAALEQSGGERVPLLFDGSPVLPSGTHAGPSGLAVGRRRPGMAHQ